MRKIFYIVVNDEDSTGMNAISLVESPAVEHDFLCFSKEKQPVKMQFDDAKHIITGVVCLADTPIYRYSESLGEYWVVFTKDEIEKMVTKYSKMNLYNSVNLQHDDEQFVDGIYMVESYLTNKERGINPVEFSDVPDGSWVASYKVENDDLWNDIINGDKLNGFSLQGMFELDEKFMKQTPDEETFDEWLEKQINEK